MNTEIQEFPGIEVVDLVQVIPTAFWIEDDILGDRHVILQHEGSDAFVYASFRYDYAYTSSAIIRAQAKALAISLGATEPVEERSRMFKTN
jgi:hypothetical protein